VLASSAGGAKVNFNVLPTVAIDALAEDLSSNGTLASIIPTLNFAQFHNSAQVGFSLNYILTESDNVSIPGDIGETWDFAVFHQFGGSSVTGGRNGGLFWVQQTAPTSASNGTRDYCGITAIGDAQSGDGGTNFVTFGGSAGAKGATFGANFITRVGGTSTHFLLGVAGLEIDDENTSSVSMAYNFGLAIASFHATQGNNVDAAIAIYGNGETSDSIGNTYGPSVGFRTGISFAEIGGQGLSPISSNGTVLGTHVETLSFFNAQTGIDLTSFVFSGNAFQSTGFAVAQSGAIATASTIQSVGMLTTKDSTLPSATAMQVLAYSATVGLGIYTGTGAPSVNAAQGSLYIRIDGAAATALYLNNSSGSGTSWVAVT
jgi:hypothetical protein